MDSPFHGYRGSVECCLGFLCPDLPSVQYLQYRMTVSNRCHLRQKHFRRVVGGGTQRKSVRFRRKLDDGASETPSLQAMPEAVRDIGACVMKCRCSLGMLDTLHWWCPSAGQDHPSSIITARDWCPGVLVSSSCFHSQLCSNHPDQSGSSRQTIRRICDESPIVVFVVAGAWLLARSGLRNISICSSRTLCAHTCDVRLNLEVRLLRVRSGDGKHMGRLLLCVL